MTMDQKIIYLIEEVNDGRYKLKPDAGWNVPPTIADIKEEVKKLKQLIRIDRIITPSADRLSWLRKVSDEGVFTNPTFRYNSKLLERVVSFSDRVFGYLEELDSFVPTSLTDKFEASMLMYSCQDLCLSIEIAKSILEGTDDTTARLMIMKFGDIPSFMLEPLSSIENGFNRLVSIEDRDLNLWKTDNGDFAMWQTHAIRMAKRGMSFAQISQSLYRLMAHESYALQKAFVATKRVLSGVRDTRNAVGFVSTRDLAVYDNLRMSIRLEDSGLSWLLKLGPYDVNQLLMIAKTFKLSPEMPKHFLFEP